MSLIVAMPTEWRVERAGDERRVSIGDGVELTLSELFAAPDDDARFVQQALRMGLAPEVPVEIEQTSGLHTALGWPLTVVQARVGGGAARLLVYYRFVTYAALALACAPDAAALQRQRAPLLDVLGEARPDWSGQGIVSIAQLWDGLDTP